MRIRPRHLILLNGLTVVACVLHVLVHAIDLSVGEWHDYAVYVLVAVSFAASLLHGRQGHREPLTA
jgi:hypothetical protein